MRIGYDAKRLFYNQGGLGNYARNTIDYLSQFIDEHQYILYTPSLKNTPLFNIDNLPNNTTLGIPPKSVQGILKAYWRSKGIVSQLINDNIDIYHGLSNELPFSLKNNSGIKTIVTIHDLIFLRFPQFYKSFDRWVYKKKFYHSSITADIVIAVSEQTKRDLIEYYHIPEEKIRVSYQGCDSAYFEIRSDFEKEQIRKKYNLPKDYILSVGTIESRRNILSILKALHQKQIKIPFVVVGKSTKYINQVKSYIASKGMDKQVHFIQNANNNELSSLYQAALMTIYPSVFEGFGIPVIESLASKTPVITSNCSSLPEAGGDAAWYVDPSNIEEMGNAIISIAEDGAIRRSMIAKGNLHVEKFNGQNVANDLNNIYNSLM